MISQPFFVKKVDNIRASTNGAAPATFLKAGINCHLPVFDPVTVDELTRIVRSAPNKQSSLHSSPTWLLKDCVDLLTPCLVTVLNHSLESGHFPSSYKDSFITPLLKKPGSDSSTPKNYRPVSNISVASKMLERVVSSRMIADLEKHQLLPSHQSADRKEHSVETALTKVLSDLISSLDKGELGHLAFLDLSAAFDTVDHAILLTRLELSFGLTYHALFRFKSYLDNRSQTAEFNGKHLPDLMFHMVCHKDQSLNRSFLCCTRQTLAASPIVMICCLISTLTTLSFTSVDRIRYKRQH